MVGERNVRLGEWWVMTVQNGMVVGGGSAEWVDDSQDMQVRAEVGWVSRQWLE